MPRAKIETAFLGHYTLVALDAAPDFDAAWLIHTLCAWILRDELPTEIPPELAAVWNVVRAESELIAASMKESANARIEAAKEAAAARWRKRTDADGCGRMPTDADGCADDAEGCQAMLESKRESKSKISSANAEVERDKPRAPACEDFPDCPIPADRLRVLADHIGATPEEVSAWKDYYTAQEWRFKPASPRPMTRAAAEASLRNWHNLGGIRAAKQAHIDAKMDARAAARDPSRFAPPPEKGGIDTAALGI